MATRTSGRMQRAWTSNSSTGSTPSRSRKNMNDRAEPLFYTYVSNNDGRRGLSAITDSGACASVVRKKTLDAAMVELAIDELINEKMRQDIHRFGPPDQPTKALRAVRMPFAFAIMGSNEEVRFYVRFNVIEGDLPFLIGLTSMKAMRADLSLHFNQLSLEINDVLRRINLVYYSSHLRLPMKCRSSHQRSINKNGHRPGTGRNDQVPHVSRNKHYYIPSLWDDEKDVNLIEEKPREGRGQSTLDVNNNDVRQARKGETRLSKQELEKWYKQLRCASLTRMKIFIKEARLWNNNYDLILKNLLNRFACVLSTPPPLGRCVHKVL